MITLTKKSMQQDKPETKSVEELFQEGLTSLNKLADEMPYQPRTGGQRSLMNVSGTPQEFARSCYNAFRRFEITYGEAKTAIDKYHSEWEKAV